MAVKKKWTAEEIVVRIRAKYGQKERYAVFEQVASGTGAAAYSWIDVVSVDLWPSDGLTRRAFEVKVSRGDFLAELANSAKNAWAKECFNEFWYVAPAGVIKDENELPENCGWLMPAGSRLITKRAASRREATIDEALFASICRSAQRAEHDNRDALRKELVENDGEICDALAFRKAVDTFLLSRDIYFSRHHKGYNPEDIGGILERITGDEKDQKDAKQVHMMLETFKTSMLVAYDAYCEAAHVGILEVDKAERFLFNTWGHLLEKPATSRAKDKREAKKKAAEATIEIHETGNPK